MADERDKERVERLLGSIRASLVAEEPPEPNGSFSAGVLRSIRTVPVRADQVDKGQIALALLWEQTKRYLFGAVSAAAMFVAVALLNDFTPAGIAERIVIGELVGGAF